MNVETRLVLSELKSDARNCFVARLSSVQLSVAFGDGGSQKFTRSLEVVVCANGKRREQNGSDLGLSRASDVVLGCTLAIVAGRVLVIATGLNLRSHETVRQESRQGDRGA